MHLITQQQALDSACGLLAEADYVTVDTEFMRERTYWPKLCLLQMARPAGPWGEEAAYLIDPLSEIDLAPVFELMRDKAVIKVFHAARQDVEIFVNLMGEAPQPLFDTQIAAMVCGFGDQVGYETLVRRIAKAKLDKSSRFTDWARRPLSDKQLTYAIGDVTHLREIYVSLSKRLESAGRESWVASEMKALTETSTYVVEPEHAWKRLKTRSTDPRFLGVVKAVAEWRESEAQRRDVPRGRILKDEAVLEIAANRPETRDQLLASRALQREGRKAEAIDAILAAVQVGLAAPMEAPRGAPPPRQRSSNEGQALGDLLRVLLKAKAEKLGVAQRLIASAADIDAMAQGVREDVPALEGWRREAFGEDALRMIRGELALTAGPGGVEVLERATATV